MPDRYTIKNFSGYHSVEQRPKKLLEQVSYVIWVKHYSYKTEKSYISWIKRYILVHDKRHPKEMGSAEIEAFLHSFGSRGSCSIDSDSGIKCGSVQCRIPRTGFLGIA